MVVLKDVIQFSGRLNTDDDSYTMPAGDHKMARNVRFRGDLITRRLRAEGIPGTTEITNPLLELGANNKTIGAFFDPVRLRIFNFVQNNDGEDEIFIYDMTTKAWSHLFRDGTGNGSATVLDFMPNDNYPIPGIIYDVRVLYSDTNQGDILFYVDTQGRPTTFNIKRYQSSATTYLTPYSPMKRTFIDLAKTIPLMVPKCVYVNDWSKTVNNMRNSLFQFKVRHGYDDLQKSCYSTASEIPLPNVRIGQENYDVTNNLNNAIDLFVPTGDVDVRKIEIWVKQFSDSQAPSQVLPDNTTEYLLVASLDKDELNIPSNAMYRYRFYNDGVYTAGDPKEQDLLFDFIPLKCITGTLMRGNVPALANYTSGYDKVAAQFSATVQPNFCTPRHNYNGLLFFGTQQGQVGGLDPTVPGVVSTIGKDFVLNFSGSMDVGGSLYGTGYPTGPFPSALVEKTQFIVEVSDLVGSVIRYSYEFPVGTPPASWTWPFIINQLAAVLAGGGITLTGQDGHSATFSFNGQNQYLVAAWLENTYGDTNFISAAQAPQYQQAHFAFPRQSAVGITLAYYDAQGRTPGACAGIQVLTAEDVAGFTTNQINLMISSRPPKWARFFHILASEPLTYGKMITWVSNKSFVKTDLDSGIKYAYIAITNMELYNENNQAATPVVNYDFAPGDRIRFLQRMYSNPGSLPSNLPPYEYEVQAVTVNPVLDGTIQVGRFIKIIYPTSDINPNFDFTGINFQNYKILLFNYIKHATSATLTTFFEFGKMWGIGNAGTDRAYHFGMSPQASDLSAPAVISFDDGNFFWRRRTVPAGQTYLAAAGNFTFDNPQWATIPVQPDDGDQNLTDYAISHQTSAGSDPAPAQYPHWSDGGYLYWNKTGVYSTIRVRNAKFNGADGTGGVKVQGSAGKPNFTSIILKICHDDLVTVDIVKLLTRFDMPLGEDLQFYTIEFDGYAQIPINAKVWILCEDGNTTFGAGDSFGIRYGIYTQQLDVINNQNILIIEPSYSDKYSIVANSNNRALVFDENAKQVTEPAKYCWGLAYQGSSAVNNMNRFYPDNNDEVDRGRGGIQKLVPRDGIMRIFQDRGVGQVGIYTKFIQDSSGNDILATTGEIITKTNVQYYEGNYGVGGHGEGVVSTKIADYYIDPVRGYAMRLSGDGQVPISELYKGQYFLRGLMTPFATEMLYNGSNFNPDFTKAYILGAYDYLEEQYMPLLQAGIKGTTAYPSQLFSFNEKRNAFAGFYDYEPEYMISANETLVTFKNGVMFFHDNTTLYNWIYDQYLRPQITLVFNDQVAIRKTFDALAYRSNDNNIWQALNAGDIKTSYVNEDTGLPQISMLLDSYFAPNENGIYAPLLRDMNSMPDPIVAIEDGDYLKGVYIEVTLTYINSDGKLPWLFAPYVKWSPSQRLF